MRLLQSSIAIPFFVLVAAGCTGADGKSFLSDVNDEPPSANCTAGGVAVTSGLDKNNDGKLSPDEVTETNYVCSGGNGTNGTNGTNGKSTLNAVTPEPAGINCPAGGAKIESGVDANNNQTLELSEVTSTSFVCGAGAAQIVTVSNNNIANANTNLAITLLQATITTPGPGKLLAISSVDAYCPAAQCPAGNPAADGYVWLSLVDNEDLPPGNHDYFFLTPNTTESMSRTGNFVVNAASTVNVFLRGKDAVNSFAYFRPAVTLVYLP